MMLDGKRAVVTGANGVLGKAVVSLATAQGALVTELDLGFDGDGEGAERYTIDLTDPAAVSDRFQQIGTVDAVFNIAGGFDMGPAVYETPAELWERLFAINVLTARNVCEAVVPTMIAAGKGSIVNVGALSAREGQPNMSAYCVAKSAVMRLTESLSREVRHHGINVNAVLPSIIDTPRNRADMPDADFTKWVAPAELAEVICFLASGKARAVHGALLPVTGLS